MKKLLIGVIMILLFLIGIKSCSTKDGVKEISKVLGIKLTGGKVVESTDSHGGFLGDGAKYMKIEFDDKRSNTIIEELENNENWYELPLSDNLSAAVYGKEYETFTRGSLILNEERKHIIPEIKEGYYFFIDRHSESENRKDDSELFNRSSYNFTISIYDTINQTLYYYELDT